MPRPSRKQLIATSLALVCIAAGWRISGFYVVVNSKTDLYRWTEDSKLRKSDSLDAGTYLRLAKRSEYGKSSHQGQTVLRRNHPRAFGNLPQQINRRFSSPDLSVGFLGRNAVSAANVTPLHSAEQHYVFEYLGWFLIGVGMVILIKLISPALRPPPSTSEDEDKPWERWAHL